MKECWYDEKLFKRASKYGPWLRAEIKGRKKYGRNLNEQIQDESVYNKGDASKVNKQVKEDDPKAQLPNGIFPAIISGSLEDQAGTREKRDAFNASDSKFHAGKENVDDPSPPINAQIEELTSQTDKEIKDKIEINDDYDSPPSDDAKVMDWGTEPSEMKMDAIPVLSIELEDAEEAALVEPISDGKEMVEEDPIEEDEPAGVHPDAL
ncbi:hypothetical protein V6N13_120970 [Hibiscus sabdariffa]